ncbi:MAG: methylamine utilization protein [Deltaproteobacteria bacterium]|nr:methylamine utilization protein [Deltaproteobacteria bacterium]MBW2361366.1 methylamine utilization protein [Deltaproteobacteria bacterium]
MFLLPPAPAWADSFEVVVENTSGQPVEFAVVIATPVGGTQPAPPRNPTVIDQVDKEYIPYVTAVQVGTSVSFPNHDPLRHHVYSFSEAKTFEIPLYKGTPRDPILFDKSGPVTLGCNIHDWMSAHVFVSESPHFAVTAADGRATLEEVPAGDYEITVWHPRLKEESEQTRQRISLAGALGSPLGFTIEEKRVWRPRRAPARGAALYR